jgi:argininosuccinate lyase
MPKQRRVGNTRLATLWSPSARPDALMLRYTVSDDRLWDARLLRWDILGSLGHVEGLRRSGLVSARAARRLTAGLRAALVVHARGRLTITAAHEDAHSSVEDWLTRRLGDLGARLHTGRSRNDQIACDLRLYLKATLLARHAEALNLADVLLDFARRHRDALWPGYTHQRRAMPSSAGLWAAALAEGVLVSAETLPAVWARVDRSPLGSAAGYGAPLRLRREAAMRALGFGGLDQVVASTQLSRGKLEAAVLFWCVDLSHDLGRLAADVILLSAEEFGLLTIPPALSTGSSIMPQKRNPDLFELTRARAASLEGDLAAVLALKAKLTGGYHRDFQLLKEPLFRGLDRTGEMLAMLIHAVPQLGVDRERGRAALRGEALLTDEVMRRVDAGTPFRLAYREVVAEHRAGVRFAEPPLRELLRRRRSTGGLGNLALPKLRARVRAARAWNRRELARFGAAMSRLAGRRVGAR